jgi:hypothetical protein
LRCVCDPRCRGRIRCRDQTSGKSSGAEIGLRCRGTWRRRLQLLRSQRRRLQLLAPKVSGQNPVQSSGAEIGLRCRGAWRRRCRGRIRCRDQMCSWRRRSAPALLAPKVAALALLAPKVQIRAVLWLLGCFGALGTPVLAAGCLGAPVLGDSGACSRLFGYSVLCGLRCLQSVLWCGC